MAAFAGVHSFLFTSVSYFLHISPSVRWFLTSSGGGVTSSPDVVLFCEASNGFIVYEIFDLFCMDDMIA